jgi:hypothetical protein
VQLRQQKLLGTGVRESNGMSEPEYIHICVICGTPLRGPFQVCGARCYDLLVCP